MSTGQTDEVEKKSARSLAREAFFIEFATAIRREFPDVPLMVTGGFRSRQGADAAIREEGCDLVGIARPAAIHASLPKDTLMNPEVKDEDALIRIKKIQASWLMSKLGIKVVGAASDTVSPSALRIPPKSGCS